MWYVHFGQVIRESPAFWCSILSLTLLLLCLILTFWACCSRCNRQFTAFTGNLQSFRDYCKSLVAPNMWHNSDARMHVVALTLQAVYVYSHILFHWLIDVYATRQRCHCAVVNQPKAPKAKAPVRYGPVDRRPAGYSAVTHMTHCLFDKTCLTVWQFIMYFFNFNLINVKCASANGLYRRVRTNIHAFPWCHCITSSSSR